MTEEGLKCFKRGFSAVDITLGPTMFHRLDKYARDDALVKLIFDHLHNIGLVALVLGAAAWKQKHIEAGWAGLWDITVGAVLAFTGMSLIWLNHENLFYKLRGSNVPRWLKLLFAILYAVVLGELLKYLEAGRA